MSENIDTIDLTYDSKNKEIVFVYSLVDVTDDGTVKLKKTSITEQRYPSTQIDALMGSVVKSIQQNKKLIAEFKDRLTRLEKFKIEIESKS